MKRGWGHFFACCGAIGFLPASGTWASLLCGLPLAWSMRKIEGCVWSGVARVLVTLVAWLIITRGMRQMHGVVSKDPSCIVLDEVVGMCWATWLLPEQVWVWVGAFCLFRLFDIRKPIVVDLMQRLPGAWGILMDDVVAGLCARSVVWLVSVWL